MVLVLVWWLWSVLCISTVKDFVLAILSSLNARWLEWNQSILLFRPTLSGVVSLSLFLTWIVAIVMSIARRLVYVRLSHMSFPYLLLVFSREVFWLLLSMEFFVFHSLLRYLTCDPRFRFCGMLLVFLLSDRSKMSKIALSSVRNWLVLWFKPADLLLAVLVGFRPYNSRYACSSSAFVKAWSAFYCFRFVRSHRSVEFFRPSIKLILTICWSHCWWSW